MKTKAIYCSFFFVLLFFATGFSQHIENSFEKGSKMVLSPKIFSYEDASQKLPFQTISSSDFASNFKLSETPRLNFGYTSSIYWIKIEARNNQYKLENWILEIAFPTLDYLEFYYEDDLGNYQKVITGDIYNFQQRPVFDNDYIFPIVIPQNSTKVFYIKTRSSGAMTYPISIASNAGYVKKSQTETLLYGLVYGIMLIMVLYNLFIFISIKDKNYGLYVFAILAGFSFMLAKNGHSLQFFLQDFPQLTFYQIIGSIGWWVIGSTIFAKGFLNTKSYSKSINLTLTIFAFIGGVIIILMFILSPSLSLRIAALFSFITAFVLLVSGILIWKKGNKVARYFVFAWSGYIIGIFSYILNSAGILPNTIFTAYAIEIGSVLEITLLSLALGDKFRLIKIQRDKAQKKLLANQVVALSIKERANKELEDKVLERTAEINEQKEELLATLSTVQEQNNEIEIQRSNIEEQSNKLSKAYKDIQSSLSYAQRIQIAKLPETEKMAAVFNDFFLLFQPKSIVSGDFYWFTKVEEKIVIAAVDCTGHGVPGAFMAMIGSELLHEIVNLRKITSPAEILSELHQGVRLTLRQADNDNRDGMDISICRIENNSSAAAKKMTFAGAKNPLVMILANENKAPELLHIKGDKLPIGGFQKEKERLFTNHSFEITEATTIYIFTDGYQDQFGGEKDRKFMIKRLKELFLEIHHFPMKKQKEILKNTLGNWMEGKEQIDDILLIGFKI